MLINAARLQPDDGSAAAQMIVVHAVRNYTPVSASSSADPAPLSQSPSPACRHLMAGESGQRRAFAIAGWRFMDATAIAFEKLSISWKRDRSSEMVMLLGAEERMAGNERTLSYVRVKSRTWYGRFPWAFWNSFMYRLFALDANESDSTESLSS